MAGATATESSLAESAPASLFWRVPWALLGLLAALVLYGIFLFAHFEPAISEPDANGYWAQGTLIVSTGRTWFRAASDAQYIGLHWLLAPGDFFVSRYPPGLPLLIGIVDAIFGYKAAVMVNPILALLAVAGTWFAARRLCGSGGWALLAAGMLAVDPIFTTHALSNDSHMAVACCIAWGIYFLLVWSQRGHLWQIFLAGIILGCIPTIRYADSVVALGVIGFILAHWRKPRFALHLLAAIAGAAIPVVPLMIRNQLLLGAFWRTGYALTNEQTGFGWTYFTEHWANYLYDMNANALGLVFALGLLGTILMLCHRRARATGVLLSLMILPMTLLYMAYYWGPLMSASTMRFLVPLVPCYILASVWLLDELTRGKNLTARLAVPLVVGLIQIAWGGTQLVGQADRSMRSKQVLAIVTDALDSVGNQNDVVLAQPQILQHLDFVRHWKLADPSLVGGGALGAGNGLFGGAGPAPGGRGAGGGRGGRGGGRGFPFAGNLNDPSAPQPSQLAKNEMLRSLYTGLNPQRRFADDVFTWANGGKVLLVGAEDELRQTAAAFVPGSTIEIVKKITIPAEPEPPPQQIGQGFGGRGGGRGGRGGRGGFGGFAGRGGAAPAGESELVIAQWVRPPVK